MIKIYNSLTKKKEEFVPIEPGKVKMYVCGPTVYNYFHIGNARPFVVFEAFRKYLTYRGFEVTFVQNFTDVDDKIINRSNEEGISPSQVSEKYIEEYFKDAVSIGVEKADVHPKVTETMEDIIEFIKGLVEKGYAYEVDGDVYFDTKRFEGYGMLSGQSLEDLEAGARVDVNESKKNPSDFALWKKKKDGEPYWDSPFGKGRPGWHIECSVMSRKYLGDTLDIHAGGQDLIFPHHENEIAQSQAFTGKKYVNYWMHNGYININNEKMSKSKNNFFTVRDILETHDGEVIRFFLLSAQYRNPVNFSEELMTQSKNALSRLYKAKENLEFLLSAKDKEDEGGSDEVNRRLEGYRYSFVSAMDDDFNTADGIAVIFELVREVNSKIDINSTYGDIKAAYDMLMELTDVLGLLRSKKEDLDSEIERLIEERQNARKNKDFAGADKIRDELKSRGIILEDTPQGVKWRMEN